MGQDSVLQLCNTIFYLLNYAIFHKVLPVGEIGQGVTNR